MEKVLVAGAGFGGIRAAIDLHRKGFDVEILDEDLKHVYTPGLIDLVRGRVSKADLIVDVEDLFSGTSIRTFEAEITGFRPQEDVVEVGDDEFEYDYLVLALGSSPRIDVGNNDVLVPYSIDEAFKLANFDGSVAVIGGGYTGVEYAAELEAKGLEVHIFDLETRPLQDFSEDISVKVLDYLNEYGIGFSGGKEAEVTEDGSVSFEGVTKNFDRVIWCGGVQPVEVVRESFGNKGLEVNRGLCSVEYDNIFGIGACNDFKPVSAHRSLEEAELVAENISREGFKELKMLGEAEPFFMISLGRTGMFVKGDQAYRNFLFRYGKDLIRKAYMLNLRKEKFLLENLV